MSERLEFVELAGVVGCNMALLCRRFGIARKTGYKWLSRYRASGEAGLAARSRRPVTAAGTTPEEMVERVVALRGKHPAWGARKLAARLRHLGVPEVPAICTVHRILQRHGLLDLRKSQQCQPVQRFEYPVPNDLWQMDFKGYVPMGAGGRCHPLTVLDDHSRYNLVLKACDNERGLTVRAHLSEAFRRYGLPHRMLMDNGSPWRCSGGDLSEHNNRLSMWLMRLGIGVIHGRPMHPQTQGKEERFHRTLVEEVLRWHRLEDLAHAQGLFDPWRQIYNHERPHEALAMQVPAQRYRPSPREFPASLPPIEYGREDQVRQVRRGGQITFKGRAYGVGKAFAGEPVALRPSRVEGVWEVYYCQQRLGQIDEREREGPLRVRPIRALAALAPESAAD
jgi:transposase InsO family protein